MRKILLFVLLFICFLPQIASPLKGQLEKRLSSQLGGQVSIEKVRLSWFASQRCQNVIWTDTNSGLVLSVDTITLKEPLMSCVRYQNQPVHLRLEGAILDTVGNFRFVRSLRNKPVHLIFSPIELTASDQILSFEELSIQINDKMDVKTKGEIDLRRNRMNLTLGLNAKTLGKVFKEARKLPEDFILEIPLSTELSGKAIEKALIGYFLKNYAKVTSLHK